MEKYFKESNAALSARVSRLRSEFHMEFGAGSKLAAALGGPAIRASSTARKAAQEGMDLPASLFVDRRNWKSCRKADQTGAWTRMQVSRADSPTRAVLWAGPAQAR